METSPKTVPETYIKEVTTLVHLNVNGEEIITTVDHPFYVKNQGFIKAGELVKVYNFQVEDFHTYHVSGFGVLVHNAGKDYSRRERMGRQKGKSPRDQKKQQKQVKAITRELKRRGVPENKIKDNIHDILHDEGMDYQEALEEALNYFGV